MKAFKVWDKGFENVFRIVGELNFNKQKGVFIDVNFVEWDFCEEVDSADYSGLKNDYYYTSKSSVREDLLAIHVPSSSSKFQSCTDMYFKEKQKRRVRENNR
jgi:hypothetical protein